MRYFCIALVSLGALIMLYSIAKFYIALSKLKEQMNERRLFGEKIYAACFIMMLFFLIGYIMYLILFLTEKNPTANSLLIALIFFFGAIFVNAMITMVRRMFTSITDREKLSREKEIAEQGSRMKGEFLSRMSHEMRTPMNAIIGMTSIGKKAEDLSRKDYCLGKIEEASKHLLGVINDVLDMSKIESSKLELTIDWFNIRRMGAVITTLVTPQTKSKNQQLHIAIDENVPTNIKTDEQRLRQVITNLLSNAVKFTPDFGTVSLFVRVISKEKDSVILQFEVTDTGIGMSEAQCAKLFVPFEQADKSISRKYGGTGLGLAISKQILEMMGSTITVTSEIGKGSRFQFDLCVAFSQSDVDLTTLQEQNNEVNETEEDNDFTGKRVLIAEDIELNREIIAALLEPTNIAIEFAENGRLAYQLLTENPQRYDIIFMDVHMPEIDGLAATKMIRAIGDPWSKTVPIIAMTADVFNEDIEKCVAAGMNGHIGKPIDIDAVLAVLHKHLSAPRQIG